MDKKERNKWTNKFREMGKKKGSRQDFINLYKEMKKEKDNNSKFSKLNPSGAGDLMNVSLLKAGHHIGINTVGQSLRNANLQVRSEPANPQMNVGPWNNTTITPDEYRRTLEIGN